MGNGYSKTNTLFKGYGIWNRLRTAGLNFTKCALGSSCLLLLTFVSLSSRLRLSSARRSLSSLFLRLSSCSCSKLRTLFLTGLASGELSGLVLTGLAFTAFTVAVLRFLSDKVQHITQIINLSHVFYLSTRRDNKLTP